MSSKDLLLIIFIHGFKGNDNTFEKFPERLQHILSETVSSCAVDCVLFPAYETKGDLNEAVTRFSDWLTTLTVEREVHFGTGAGSARIVLCGHSMGGLLAADSLLEFVKSRPDERAPLWPRIIACLAFDTPYLGLHPFIVKNGVTRVAQHVEAARNVGGALFGSWAGLGANKAATGPPSENQLRIEAPAAAAAPASSGWGKWAPAAYAVGGALLAGAAAGGLYYKREDIGLGYTWATDHMKYVGNLWDEQALKQRMDDLLEVEQKHGVTFRVYYTVLPPIPLSNSSSRTFVVLPKSGTPLESHYFPAPNNNVSYSEVDAHTGMFNPRTNDGYFDLGLQTAGIIRETIENIKAEGDQ